VGYDQVDPRCRWIPMTGKDPKSEARRPRSERWWLIGALLMFVTVIFIVSSPYLNTLAVETVRCEIVSAEPRTTSGGGRGSVSTAAVVIRTSNCGSIALDRGISFDIQDDVAASFERGAEYEFDIGWYSRVVWKGVLNNIPSAQDYRPAS
jgi:hypothetical protein